RVRQDVTNRSLSSTGHIGLPLLLRTLSAVLGAPLTALTHTCAIERAADGVVAHARQILHAATADEHDRVLLQVVTLATDVAGDLVTVDQPDTAHLAQRRIRLLRRRRVDARTYPALLGRAPERRH